MTAPEPPFPEQVLRHQPLARFTAARLGGPADYLYIAKDPGFRETLAVLRIAWSHGLPVAVIGGGANVLVADKGIRGLTVINRATQISHETCGSDIHVSASSGANLIRLVRYCQERGFEGMEWAIAVPGTVGGAVVNNAGAHGGDMANTLRKALIFESGQGKTWYDLEELNYAYRYSELKARADTRFFVMKAVFQLKKAQPAAILRRMNEFSDYRKRTQPPGASLGSIFKNPPGDYAGAADRGCKSQGLSHWRCSSVPGPRQLLCQHRRKRQRQRLLPANRSGARTRRRHLWNAIGTRDSDPRRMGLILPASLIAPYFEQ